MLRYLLQRGFEQHANLPPPRCHREALSYKGPAVKGQQPRKRFGEHLDQRYAVQPKHEHSTAEVAPCGKVPTVPVEHHAIGIDLSRGLRCARCVPQVHANTALDRLDWSASGWR